MVFPFEQNRLDDARRTSHPRGTMTTPETDKDAEYARYAEHCLNMVAATTDQQWRRVQREMAAEWLRLAEASRNSSRSKRHKTG
jgi:hypothetical protein